MSSYRGANQSRTELKGFYQTKPGAIKLSSTQVESHQKRWVGTNYIGIKLLRKEK